VKDQAEDAVNKLNHCAGDEVAKLNHCADDGSGDDVRILLTHVWHIICVVAQG
jgi:hypothetical protein